MACSIIWSSEHHTLRPHLAGSQSTLQQHRRGQRYWGSMSVPVLRIHQQLPQDHPRRATIYYDSTYAYGVVTRLTKGRENTELIDTVASLLEATRRIFQVDFKHIRARTDIYGNEAADRLAGRGAAGNLTACNCMD